VDPFAPLLSEVRANDGLLAPHVLESDGRTADAARRLLTPWQFLQRATGIRAPVPPEAVDWLAGMFLLLRAQAFAETGGFDERFFMYCEDADLSIRLRLAGWGVRQVTTANVVHLAQRASRSSAQHLMWHISSVAKHWGSSAFWRYLVRRGSLRGYATELMTHDARASRPRVLQRLRAWLRGG
jgi:GT2 family glycosyltransferase